MDVRKVLTRSNTTEGVAGGTSTELEELAAISRVLNGRVYRAGRL